jgi:hypothetical protein
MKSDPLVAVVRLQGAIMANPRGAGLSDQAIAPAIERAFKKGKPVPWRWPSTRPAEVPRNPR